MSLLNVLEDNDPWLYWTNKGGEWHKVITTAGEYRKFMLDNPQDKFIDVLDKSTY